MQPNKACPVLIRSHQTSLGVTVREILAFTHPKAGKQLIKGTIEPGESPAIAAVRELCEESGIVNAKVVQSLGLWDAGVHGQRWAFFLCSPLTSLPNQWSHFTSDGGGHTFTFFWQPLDEPLTEAWHPVFVGAVNYIRSKVA